MSKLKQANKKIEDFVVGSYQKIEDTVVSSYQKVENKFVETFLAEEGETTTEAKVRLQENKEERKQKRDHQSGRDSR